MEDDINERTKPRRRAFKACQRCNSRKAKCDASQVGVPCTRCRVDGVSGCAFINSKRGTYDRWRLKAHKSPRTLSNPDTNGDVLSTCSTAPGAPRSHHSESTITTPHVSREDISTSGTPIADEDSASIVAVHDSNNSEVPGAARSNALASAFENFLKQQGREAEGLVGKYGLVLLGDSSPLTFALKELQPGRPERLTGDPSQSSDGQEVTTAHGSVHPSHLSAVDITYLQAKGAFTSPSLECLNSLIQGFVNKFYPLYSIVNRSEFLQQHESGTIPWILLHAACLIGASYCDEGVIKSAGFKSRQTARRIFYERAKVLYDVGYEPNSIVLLQAIILLTFWGPDMKSYWNPCSWIGVAVTIAESIGIHRASTSSSISHKDKGLLRRMWWAITIRDAHCGTLLGRPFRVNMAHCDTEMLTPDDYSPEHETYLQSHSGHPFDLPVLYQIQLSKLSLILRQIVNVRFNVGFTTTPQSLHESLNSWRRELPPGISWPEYGPPTSIFSESLKLLFHHHLILIYLARGDTDPAGLSQCTNSDAPTSEIAKSAAQTISAASLNLMTKSMVHSMPQEIFPAFFVAGIVFFRLIRRSQSLVAQLGQSALDNCQIVLNEVRDCWEPAFWGMRIFDFLLAGVNKRVKSNDETADQEEVNVSSPALAAAESGEAIKGPVSIPDSFALQDTFEMGLAIHTLRNTAQQRQLDTGLTTQLYDRFLDPENYFMMPTYFGTSDGYDFDMGQY